MNFRPTASTDLLSLTGTGTGGLEQRRMILVAATAPAMHLESTAGG